MRTVDAHRIENLLQMCGTYHGVIAYDTVISVLHDVPTVEPQQWIPVSSGHPEAGIVVWVTIKGHDVITAEEGETLEQALERIGKIRWVTRAYWSEEEHGWNDPEFGCPLIVKPIAWMPMNQPEPWEGGAENE